MGDLSVSRPARRRKRNSSPFYVYIPISTRGAMPIATAHVLGCLIHYMNRDGFSSPSYPMIMEFCGISRNLVARSLKLLVDTVWVFPHPRKNRPTVYDVNPSLPFTT